MKFKVLILIYSLLSITHLNCNFRQNKMNDNTENIIEGTKIGNYSLSLSKKELDNLKGAKREFINDSIIYSLPNIKIWYNTTSKSTDQICAYSNFKGKFRGIIGINDNLLDLEKIEKFTYSEDDGIYEFDSIKGICFNVYEGHLKLSYKDQKINYICIY